MKTRTMLEAADLFVGGQVHRILRSYGHEHFTAAIYLTAGPAAHISGLLRLSPSMLAIDCCIEETTPERILDDLGEVGFLDYCPTAAVVWVTGQVAREWCGKPIQPDDWRAEAVLKQLRGIPDCPPRRHFLEAYPEVATWAKNGLPPRRRKGASKGAMKGASQGARQAPAKGAGKKDVCVGHPSALFTASGPGVPAPDSADFSARYAAALSGGDGHDE